MTDRDLFYCGDFQCDGHARSNERCFDPETLLPIPGHSAAEPAPTYKVSGNAVRVVRLDAQGNPTGEPIDLSGFMTRVEMDIPSENVTDLRFTDLDSITLDITLSRVDPEIIALLTGHGTPPEHVEVIDIRSRWQRFVDRFDYWLEDKHPTLDYWYTMAYIRAWHWIRKAKGWLR